MAGVEYRDLLCRSALNRVRGMPFDGSLNPYRGCVHRCPFCFASSTHQYLDLGGAEDFFGIIFVKTNLPAVRARELSKRTWRRQLVAVGTATDPHQPVEGRYKLTRQCLEGHSACWEGSVLPDGERCCRRPGFLLLVERERVVPSLVDPSTHDIAIEHEYRCL